MLPLPFTLFRRCSAPLMHADALRATRAMILRQQQHMPYAAIIDMLPCRSAALPCRFCRCRPDAVACHACRLSTGGHKRRHATSQDMVFRHASGRLKSITDIYAQNITNIAQEEDMLEQRRK